MPLTINLARSAPARADLHVVGITAEMSKDGVADLDAALLAGAGFAGGVGESAYTTGSRGPVLAIGLGPEADVDAAGLRAAGAAISRAARKHKRISVDALNPVPDEVPLVDAAQALTEGLVLGSYEFLEHKTAAEASTLANVTLVGSGGVRVRRGVDRGLVIANAVNTARDFVNEPGGTLTPTVFARRAAALAKEHGITAKVMDAAAIKRARLGGLLGVNRGSEQQPRFVELAYRPRGAKRHIALVGKGITFDAGGLSIKSGAGMMTMKCDMGGGAAVIGAMAAIGQLAPKVRVTAYVPMTDNMLGGDATRPGDVLRIRNGKTVEVLNTDAEGRLILADALSLASEAKPDAIIDLATLTGACMVALGPRFAGVMGTHDAWTDEVLAAGGRTNERVWHLPLPTEYRSMLDSTVADVKNIGGAHAGALTAGLFLKEFVAEGIPWVHVDIAGPGFTDTGWDEHPKGGTGYGVRLLVDLIEHA